VKFEPTGYSHHILVAVLTLKINHFITTHAYNTESRVILPSTTLRGPWPWPWLNILGLQLFTSLKNQLISTLPDGVLKSKCTVLALSPAMDPHRPSMSTGDGDASSSGQSPAHSKGQGSDLPPSFSLYLPSAIFESSDQQRGSKITCVAQSSSRIYIGSSDGSLRVFARDEKQSSHLTQTPNDRYHTPTHICMCINVYSLPRTAVLPVSLRREYHSICARMMN
jgi:hypothetical protein